MRQHIKLCECCEKFPASTGDGLICHQCKYGASKSESELEPVKRREQAHTFLSSAVAKGWISGQECLTKQAEYDAELRARKFFPRRKADAETPEERRARLAMIAAETRSQHPEWFAS